jgi:pimeloyl-ACP methyl ester carboxylesterase
MVEGLAELACSNKLPQSEIDAYASILNYQDGIAVQHEIIKYLNERSENEVVWLETLERSNIPTTIIWCELDAIAPVAVPDHVWINYLKDRETPAAYWRVPCADHYLQMDTTDLIENIVRTILSEDGTPLKLDGTECQAKRKY